MNEPMVSISATELAKLGKCDMLIQPRSTGTKRHFKRNHGELNGNAYTMRGQRAHDKFEIEAESYMSEPNSQKPARTAYMILAILLIFGGALLLTLVS